jgi:uncharacterized protein (DUF58 family)
MSGPGSTRVPPPAPIWVSVPGIALQGCGMFLLPFLVGSVAALLFEVSEVTETGTAMLVFTAVILFPISMAQVLGLVHKSWRDLGYWRSRRALGVARLLDILHTHLRVVTLRGWMLLGLGLCLTFLSLALKWAEFGLMAVIGLFLFYMVTGWTVFASTFLVNGFERSAGRRRSAVGRQMVPAVVQSGETVEEVLSFQRVPIPWGYLLLVEDRLPVRLATESRYVVGSSAGRPVVECRGRLRATPRGHYFLGPARLWYQDLLGITMVSIASAASAELKVLPHFRAVEVVDPPKTPQQTPDVLTRPHRFPTEDYFRFREYAAGDDTRRIHWRLSLRAGRLQVRQPETKEINTQDVLLVLDSYLPRGKLLDAALGADEIMDALVAARLGIARALIEKGDRVTLVAAVTGHDRDDLEIQSVPCRRGEAARWQDLGARSRWQGRFDVPDLLAEAGDNAHGVIVTARFTAAPPGPLPGQTMTWLLLDPADALGDRDPHWLVQIMGGKGALRVLGWILRLPHPVGSEDNAAPRRVRAAWQVHQLWTARARLRITARRRAGATLAELTSRGDAIYRIERHPTHVRLVGLHAGASARGAS